MPAAHSDGDSVVFFHRADVIVTGDILDTTRFPVIDVARAAASREKSTRSIAIVEMTVPPFPLAFQEDRTYVVPGHGFVCDLLRPRGVPEHGADHARPGSGSDRQRA